VDSSRRLRWSTTAKDEEWLVAVDKEHSEQTASEERASKEASSEGKASGVPRWLVVTGALALTIVAILIVYGYLARPKPEWIGVANKNVWDWLALLVVPAALAMGVYWLNTRQAARQQRESDRRQASEEAAQDAQAQQARALEDQRAQDAALQGYLDQMSHLLTDAKRPLRRAQPSDDLSIVARARTLTVLPRLDYDRKARVLQFLYESGVIAKERPVLDLRGADFSAATLGGADLREAYLREANLGGPT
jgi:Pentapeptide repeats (8 copies)